MADKLAKVTDRALSWREYMFWYMYLTAGDAQLVMELEDAEFSLMRQEFLRFLRGKKARDVSL